MSHMPMPMSYPTENSHRALLWRADNETDDHGRLPTLAADALGAARQALWLLPHLPVELQEAIHGPCETLAAHVARRDLVSRVVVVTLDRVFEALDDARRAWPERLPDDVRGRLDRFDETLGEVRRLVDRVLDHLAAERAIRRARAEDGDDATDHGGRHD